MIGITTAICCNIIVEFGLLALSLNFHELETCIGRNVTNTSVLFQCRGIEIENGLSMTPWKTLAEVDSNYTVNLRPNVGKSSGVQFRLLQLQHGGGECNCWTATMVTLSADVAVLCPILQPSRFCGGSAREFISPFYFQYNVSLTCPRIGATSLIS